MRDYEHIIQTRVVKYLRFNGFLVFAIPNGQKRDLLVAKKLKAEGVLAGTADLMIVLQNKVVFVEMKTNVGHQRESQKIFQEEVEKRGHEYFIWRSLDDAVEFVAKNKDLS